MIRIVLFSAAVILIASPVYAGVQTLNRDAAGRLTAAAFTNGLSIAYAYDSAGNLTQRQFSVGGEADSDGDGMDDAWEHLYFGNLSRDGTGDFDGDRFRDLHEFVAGTVPNDAGSALKLLREINVGGNVTVQWQSVAGKTYRLQFKNSLTDPDWTDLAGTVTATGPTAAGMDVPSTGRPARVYRVILVP
jgi:YD repeat-containing protein